MSEIIRFSIFFLSGLLSSRKPFIWGSFPGSSPPLRQNRPQERRYLWGDSYRTVTGQGYLPPQMSEKSTRAQNSQRQGPTHTISTCLGNEEVRNHIKSTLWPQRINITNKQNQRVMCTLICWQIFKKLTSAWMTHANTTTKPFTPEKNNSQSKPPGL